MLPINYKEGFEYIMNLKYQEKPDYFRLKLMFLSNYNL